MRASRCRAPRTVRSVPDEFGDFWFNRLDAGDYAMRIEADGYEPVEQAVRLEKSLNVGDFPLVRLAGNEVAEPVKKPAALDVDAPLGEPDVEVVEVGDVTAAFSVMSQAETEGGGLRDDGGIAKS